MVLKDHHHRSVVGREGDLATVSRHEDAVTAIKIGYEHPPRNAAAKKVRVAEERNVYHQNPMPLTQKEIMKQWYSRLELKAMLGRPVHLELWVKVKDNWADSDKDLQSLGYDNA